MINRFGSLIYRYRYCFNHMGKTNQKGITDTLEVLCNQIPKLPVPLRWRNTAMSTRSFTSTSIATKQSSVQVVQRAQVAPYIKPKATPKATNNASLATENNVSTTANTASTQHATSLSISTTKKQSLSPSATVATSILSPDMAAMTVTQTTVSNIAIDANATKAAKTVVYKQAAPTLSAIEQHIRSLPPMELPPHYSVICSTSREETDKILKRMMNQESVFGMDMEWEVIFRKHAPQPKTGLIQICGMDTILLIQVAQMTALPDELVKFLTNNQIYKTGVNVRGDGVKLYRDFRLCTDGLLELGPMADLAKVYLPPFLTYFSEKSLRALTGIYLETHMTKDSVRISKWNRRVLNDRQISYAAKDAYASYALYHRMMHLANIDKSRLRLHHLSREGI